MRAIFVYVFFILASLRVSVPGLPDFSMEKEGMDAAEHQWPGKRLPKIYRSTSAPWGRQLDALILPEGSAQPLDDGDLPTGGQRGDILPLRTRLGLTPFSIVEEEPERLMKENSSSALGGSSDETLPGQVTPKASRQGCGPLQHGSTVYSPALMATLEALSTEKKYDDRSQAFDNLDLNYEGSRTPERELTDGLVSPSLHLHLPRDFDSAKMAALTRTTGRMLQVPNTGPEVSPKGAASDSRVGDKRWPRVGHDLRGTLGTLQMKFDSAKEKVNVELRTFAEDISLRLQSTSRGTTPTSSTGTSPRTPPGGYARRPGAGTLDWKEWKESENGNGNAERRDHISPENLAWMEGAKQLRAIAFRCADMTSEEFAAVCEDVVQDLNRTRAQLSAGPMKQLHTRMLFILTRCTRILQLQKENAMREESPLHRFFHPKLESPSLDRTWAPPPSPARDWEFRSRTRGLTLLTPPAPAPWRLRDPEALEEEAEPADWRLRDPEISGIPIQSMGEDAGKAESLRDASPRGEPGEDGGFRVSRGREAADHLDFGAGAGQAALLANKLAAYKKNAISLPPRKTSSSRLAGKGGEELQAVVEEEHNQKEEPARLASASSSLGRGGDQYILNVRDGSGERVVRGAYDDRAKDLAEAVAVDTWDEDDDEHHAVEAEGEEIPGTLGQAGLKDACELQRAESETMEPEKDAELEAGGPEPVRQMSTGRRFPFRYGYWGHEEEEDDGLGEFQDDEDYLVVCRICEDRVNVNILEEHSRLCTLADECDAQGMSVDERLNRLSDALDRLASDEAGRLGVVSGVDGKYAGVAQEHGHGTGKGAVQGGSRGGLGKASPARSMGCGSPRATAATSGLCSSGLPLLTPADWAQDMGREPGVSRTASGSSDQWAQLTSGSQPSPIAGLISSTRDFPDHYLADSGAFPDGDELGHSYRFLSAASSATSSPATMMSGVSSAMASSSSSDLPSGEEASPRAAVAEVNGLHQESAVIGSEIEHGMEDGILDQAREDESLEMREMEELATIARDAADVLQSDDDAEEFLNQCLQDLQELLQENNGRFISIDTFGRRVKDLLEDKFQVIRGAVEGGSLDTYSDFGEDYGAVHDEDGLLLPRSGRTTPLHHAAQRQITIDDFEIIKPISRGAFGRVFLARKKTTGDLFAMKVLRKSDMVRKNAVESVQAERNILVTAQSPFVVRFFYSFTCRDNLYLVMEYLNGGDMYSLLRHLGCLEESMARIYIAELVLALEYLHSLGVVHRDLKPDNLLVAHDGHIKLTDFGLSKIGLVNSTGYLSGQQGPSEPSSPGNILSQSGSGHNSPSWSREGKPFQASLLGQPSSGSASPQGSSRSGAASPQWQAEDSSNRDHSVKNGAVGTPDYLAPEILLGTGHGPTADWWSVGIILFEFLTGVPPFNATTPELIFENILNHHIPWPNIPEEMSFEAHDLLERLLAPDPKERLGYRGAGEVKAHPFFRNVRWDTLAWEKAAFIPTPDHPTDTSYFTTRHLWTPLQEEPHDDSDCDSETSDSTSTTQFARHEEGDETQDLAEFDREPATKYAFSNFSFKNLSQLASINYDLLGRSGRDSPGRDALNSPGRDFHPSPARSYSFNSPGGDFQPSPARHSSHSSPARDFH